MRIALERISGRKSWVAVIGLGHAELPLAMTSVRAVFQIIGTDVDQSKVDLIIARKSYIPDGAGEYIWTSVQGGLLSAKSDYNALREVDALLVRVPLPE